jgi:hypothetical protein
MKLFGRIFGTREERKIKDLLRKTEIATSEVYRPLGDLGLGVVKAAWDCYQDFSRILRVSVEGRPTEQQTLVFYEFLYFFIHVTMRGAVAHGLTEMQISKVQDFLGPLLSHTAVDTFCRHWPLQLKERMAHEFLEKVNDAEADYSQCRAFMLKDQPFAKESLTGKLSHNVAELWGSPYNPAVMMAATTSAVKAYANMPLDELIREVATVIDRVEPDALAALRDRAWS